MKRDLFLSILLSVFFSCGVQAGEAPAPPASTPSSGQSDTSGAQPPAGQIDRSAGHKMMGIGVAAPQNAEPISGKVLETMDSGGYTYIHLQKKNGGKAWVAVMEMPVKVGSRMSFKPGVVMTNFESKGLKRTFDTIVFSDGPVAPAADAPAALLKKQSASPGSKGAAAVTTQKISVTKATGPNAITVAEAFTNSTKLDKKKVVIRGMVVKVSTGIMKRNWIHIQDGSGSQAKGTNNLVCTSQDRAEVGDVVTVSGTLAKDRDFGSGYRYSTIIESARIKK